MKSLFTVIFFSFYFLFTAANAQEINCNVIINSEKVQTTEKSYFTSMKNDITNFINNRKWTNDAFNPEERIKMNLFITLLDGDVNKGNYSATVQVQAIRPVYNSSYETVILNFLDKNFAFDYLPSQPMYFNETSFLNDLTANLGYYVYMALGMDYDSFAPLGGTPYFDKARTIAQAAMISGRGWDESESNSRYWLQENFNSQQFLAFREGFYKYHRLALDNFTENQDKNREIVLEFLRALKQVNILKPYSLGIRSMFLAKNDEFVNVFSRGDRKIREEASQLLRELDPLNSEKYMKILKN
jgi:hypothetical protein